MRCLNGVLMTNHASTLDKHWLKEPGIRPELSLTGFCDLCVFFPPHRGYDNHIFGAVIAAELSKERKVSFCDTPNSGVGNPVHIYNTAE